MPSSSSPALFLRRFLWVLLLSGSPSRAMCGNSGLAQARPAYDVRLATGTYCAFRHENCEKRVAMRPHARAWKSTRAAFRLKTREQMRAHGAQRLYSLVLTVNTTPAV